MAFSSTSNQMWMKQEKLEWVARFVLFLVCPRVTEHNNCCCLFERAANGHVSIPSDKLPASFTAATEDCRDPGKLRKHLLNSLCYCRNMQVATEPGIKLFFKQLQATAGRRIED